MIRSRHNVSHAALCAAVTGLSIGLCGSAFAQDTPERGHPPDPTEKPRLVQPAPATVVIPVERIYAGWSPRPLGTNDTTANVPLNTVQMYQDSNFKDDVRAIDNITAHASGTPTSLEGMMEDSLTSLRWNLPPGVIVMFFEDDGGTGERIALWGKGEVDTVSKFDFNDKASSWAWYYAGGAARPSVELERAAVVFPDGTVVITQGVAPPAPATMSLYKHKNFEGEAIALTDVTAQPANQLHPLPPDMNDKLTSLRWNLPPGVVVMFYQDAGGHKQQAAVWGSGQVEDVDSWDMNDKVSRWSWHYIGSPETEVLGYTPPVVIVPPTPDQKDSISLVARAMTPNKLDVGENELLAKKNPTGEGTFVYVPRTQFEGVERQIIWIVVDGKAYAISGPAKMITPTLLTPADANDLNWAKTGLNKTSAEQDAAKIVFAEE